MAMKTMSTGQAIIERVLAHGVDTVFGLPGAQTYPLFDAMAQAGDRVRLIGARHEQATAYMAMGYAKTSGRPGVYTVVPGPGVLNTTAALCTAYGTSTPVMCITGETPKDFIGKGRGHLHELPDQRGLLRTLIRWADRVESPAAAPAMVDEAFRQMLGGRPGPVALEAAWDVLATPGDVADTPAPGLPAKPEPNSDEITAAAKILAGAKSPLIWVGSGAQDAAAEVLAVAERLGAPVGAFRGGRGIVASDHPLGLAFAEAKSVWAESDVVLAIGSRMEGPYMRWQGMAWTPRPATPTLVRIDIDGMEHARLPADQSITADAAMALRALLPALDKVGAGKADRLDAVQEAKARTGKDFRDNLQPQMNYLDAIRTVLPRDGIFVEELCQAGYVSYSGFPVYNPRTYVTSGYQGTLGYGFMTALGAKAAMGDTPVVSIAGDGGFLFGVQELATAAQFGLNVVSIVFDNGAYGNVRRDQIRRFQGRELGSYLENPDFLKMAESFGVIGLRAETPADLKPALEKAFAANAPVLIHCPVTFGSEADPWPYIIEGR